MGRRIGINLHRARRIHFLKEDQMAAKSHQHLFELVDRNQGVERVPHNDRKASIKAKIFTDS
jgi:hypothetical protein